MSSKVCAFCLGTVASDGFVDLVASWWFFLSDVILNSRLMEIGAWTVSLRKKKATRQPTRENVAGIAQGRKYGYFLRNAFSPNRSGNLSAGRARNPPIIGPS